MVVDFGLIKKVFHSTDFGSRLDHSDLNESIRSYVQNYCRGVWPPEFMPQTSAENLAVIFYHTLEAVFDDLPNKPEVMFVEVHETRSSAVRYMGGRRVHDDVQ